MNKFGIILAHTYFTRLKSRAFIITTAVALLIVILLGNVDKIVNLFINDDVDRIAVIDESDEILPLLIENVMKVNNRIEFENYKDSVEDGKKAVSDDVYKGLLHLITDDSGLPTAVYYTNKASESMSEQFLEQQLQQIKVIIVSERVGIEASVLESIYEPINFERVALDETTKSDEELSQARGLVYVMLFVLYITVIVYGQMIAMDVATEKSSRVMEILISSASPAKHMFAKITGIALLGLTQLFIFFIVGYFLILSRMEEMTGEFFEVFGFGNTSISVYIYAIIFFILGYYLYATIAAMLGSLVSRAEDVGQLLLPMISLIVVAFFIAIFGLNVPESTFITVTSFIPFFTPMIMFLRVGMLDVDMWQIIVSIIIMLGTIGVFGWLGARIFRGGVLMYGPSKSWKDFRNAFMISKKE